MVRYFVFFLLIILTELNAQDSGGWTKWRGPNGNGTISSDRFNTGFTDKTDNVVWKTTVGIGYSSMAVTDRYLLTVGRERVEGKSRDVIYCLENKTGRIKWTAFYQPQNTYQYPGPRAMPVIDENLVYIFGADGDVLCLTLEQGKKIWQRNIKSDGAAAPEWGFAGTPVIDGDKLILNACSAGIALNKKNGSLIWKTPGGICGYASPVLFDHNGRRLAAIFSTDSLKIVDIADGTMLDSTPWVTSYKVNAADPVITADGKIFVTSSYNKGAALFDFSTGELKTVWTTTQVASHFSSPVIKNNYLYAADGNTFAPLQCRIVCMDLSNGKVVWSERLGYYGSLIMVNDNLVVLNENGDLAVAKATPTGFSGYGSMKIYSGRGIAWVAPVFWDGYLYLRSNTGEVVCIRTW